MCLGVDRLGVGTESRYRGLRAEFGARGRGSGLCFRAGLGAAPFGPGLFEIMHLGKVKLWGQIRGRAVWDHITCFG